MGAFLRSAFNLIFEEFLLTELAKQDSDRKPPNQTRVTCTRVIASEHLLEVFLNFGTLGKTNAFKNAVVTKNSIVAVIPPVVLVHTSAGTNTNNSLEKLTFHFGTAVLTTHKNVLFHEGATKFLGTECTGHPFTGTRGNLLTAEQITVAKERQTILVQGLARRMHAAKVVVKPTLLAAQGISWAAGSEDVLTVRNGYSGPYGATEEGPRAVPVEPASPMEDLEDHEVEERVNTSDEEKEAEVVMTPRSRKRVRVMQARALAFSSLSKLGAKRNKK
ncbi:hypothetical protein CYMTET_27422 [Cymbomonas tetramitiformis]|uniref:Uncharacterized protein n=1 Tax=Cymbomonas tetramitiformis TaxID=36881 RepID=A0AAE0FQE8_9CHLO|nr:hypothetical protein CYMTET_27422 [Cymbomonas tetramitiformis]